MECDHQEEEEPPMDDLEPEQLEDPQEAKKKPVGRKHRSEVEQADLHYDEQVGLTIYIDNLPNHPDDIVAQIA